MRVAPRSLAGQLYTALPFPGWVTQVSTSLLYCFICNEGRIGCLAALLWVECSPVCKAQSDSCWHQAELAEAEGRGIQKSCVASQRMPIYKE